MSNIYKAFLNKPAFISFVTAGDPDLDTTKQLILKMQDAGADLIEIGIPFSDPIAEGQVIEEANIRALSGGTTTDKIFDMLNEIKEKINVPLCFLTYINPIYTYGVERFMKNASDGGISGLIIPDLPFEEKDEIIDLCNKYDIDLISLIAPTSKSRIEKIAKQAKGFVYLVSSMGVTGVRSEISTDIKEIVDEIKKSTSIPCAVGFGISTPEQAAKISKISDGVIVGSAIVKIVAQYKKDSPEYVYDYVKAMKQAISER